MRGAVLLYLNTNAELLDNFIIWGILFFMSVRMRSTRSHTGNRRSHHALKEPRVSTCKDCGSSHLRHHVCENCGKYRSRVVIDVVAKMEKKEKKMKARQVEMGEEKSDNRETSEEEVKSEKALDPADLSKKV